MEYRSCWLCGKNGCCDPLDTHHIFGGRTGTRKLCDKYGLTVPLCHDACHENGKFSAHKNAKVADRLHRYGQRKAMLEQGWNVDEFRQVFGKNYLDEEELDEIAAIQRGEAETDDGGYEVTEDEWPEWLCA